MRMSFAVPISGSWATPDNIVQSAQRAEQLGYHGLWTFQRLLYPAVTESDRWAPVYRSVLDPLVLLGYLAGVTSRARLGVAIVDAPFYTPITLAKKFAAIDVLSGGRLDAGLGLGWSPDEFAAANAPYEKRGRRMDDFLQCLDAILSTDGPVDYKGAFYSVPNAYVEPRPVQRPRPPMIVGGVADAALRRAGRLADGWVSASRADLSSVGASIQKVRDAASEAGRDVDALRFICRGVVKVRDKREGTLSGSYDEIRADLAALADAGMTETFIDLNFDPEIGSVEADPKESVRRAEEVLEALAPAAPSP
ncbi:MAG: LLM class flavin-dependent oxidoreductase [Actinomycetes bacterium]